MLIMRLVRPAHGKPYFLVKVQSAHKTAKITISLKNKHGKTIGKITKTIATNKLVKIQSSLIKLSVQQGRPAPRQVELRRTVVRQATPTRGGRRETGGPPGGSRDQPRAIAMA